MNRTNNNLEQSCSDYTPEDWKIVPLKDIVHEGKPIVYGIVQAGPHVEDGIPYIKSSDIRRSVDLKSLQRTSLEIAGQYKRSEVRPGDIVFSLRGNIGACCIVPDDIAFANLTQGTARISVKDSICKDFVYYALHSSTTSRQIAAVAKGSTFQEISLEELRKLSISLPPLPEQRKIAVILSTWDEAIDLTERLIAAKQRRKQALMQRLLTWQVRFPGFSDEELSIGRFDDFIVLQRGFDLPVSEREAGAIKVIASNGQVGFHIVSKVKGPGVITGRSGTIGNVHYEENDFWPLNTTLYVKDFKGNYPLFVFYFLQQFHLERFGTGSGVPTLNRNDVHQTIIQFPILDEQIRIAQFLHVIDEEISLHQQKLAALRRQKQGLMQQLLTGKIRVKG